MKNKLFDEIFSLWWKYITLEKITPLQWMLLDSQEIYCSDKDTSFWWTMATLMEAHASDEIPDENILFGKNLCL